MRVQRTVNESLPGDRLLPPLCQTVKLPAKSKSVAANFFSISICH
jgi:hypothetical protein